MRLQAGRLPHKLRADGLVRLQTQSRRKVLETVCFERRRGPYGAVKGAVRRVNLWLKRNEQLNQEEHVTSKEIITDAPHPPPKVLLRVRTRCSTTLQENAAPGTNLKSYLNLPVSEYSLLDPRWIQLAPNKGSTFRVTIPVNDLLGIDMGPIVADVKVRQDHLRNNVTFFIEGVTFGKPDLDKLLSVRLRLFLFSSGQRRNWIPFRRRSSPEVDSFLDDFHDLQRIKSAGVPLPDLESGTTEEDDDVSFQSYDSISIETDTEDVAPVSVPAPIEDTDVAVVEEEQRVRLNCAVQLRLNVAIPPVLAFIPRIIIGSAGRIILRHMVNGALPNFLDLVVADYHAWATGSPRGIQREHGLFQMHDTEQTDDESKPG